MPYESFQIRFHWKNNPRQIWIRTQKSSGITPDIAIYEVIWKNTHLFTIYPTFNKNSSKVWKIVEEERESHLPFGFITALGGIIDNVYLSYQSI